MEKKSKQLRLNGSIALLGIICVVIAGFFALRTGSNTVGAAHAAADTCDVKSYGATGNGTTKDTAAIQKAINACTGGGTVVFTNGTYLTAPLFLKSNITLNVESGATILGSQTTSDYKVTSGEKV